LLPYRFKRRQLGRIRLGGDGGSGLRFKYLPDIWRQYGWMLAETSKRCDGEQKEKWHVASLALAFKK